MSKNLPEKTIQDRILQRSTLSESEIKQGFETSYKNLITCWEETAIWFCAMKMAGLPTGRVSSGIASVLMMIGSGQILPEVMTIENEPLRRALRRLPTQQQKEVIEGKRMPLVVIEGGRTSIRNVDPKSLEAPQVKQLFAKGSVRTEEEQRSYIESLEMKSSKKTKAAPAFDVYLDERKGNLVTTGAVVISRSDLIKYALKAQEIRKI